MTKLKYYATAIITAAIAILLAVIRHKNNKLAEMGAKLEITKHDTNIAIKSKELAAANEKYAKSRAKFEEWEKEYGEKYPGGSDSDQSG